MWDKILIAHLILLLCCSLAGNSRFRQTEGQTQCKVSERNLTMASQMLRHHHCASNLSNSSIQLNHKTISPAFLGLGEGRDAPCTYPWYYEFHVTTKRAAQVTAEKGQGTKFSNGQIRVTANDSPQGRGEPLRWSEIEKWRERRGQAFTLNDWDRWGRERG